jgi:DNA polymerase-3 subunit delta'
MKDPFDDILGQGRPKSILKGALQRDTLASSYLFFGPRGTGKLAMALALARAVNCRAEESRPCGRCSACQRIAHLQHPDVTVIFPRPRKIKDEDLRRSLDTLAANPYADLSFSERSDIHIDTIRELRSQAVLRPYEGRKKIFILAEADRLRLDAANALLKTLEEPPRHVLLVLTTTRPGRLPATVLSRCQQVRFAPLSRQEVARGLERLSLGDPKSRRLASRLAQGDLRQAMELLKEDLQAGRREMLQVLSAALRQDFTAILRWGQKLSRAKNRADSRRRLEALQVWYRDLMLLGEGNETDLVNADLISQLSEIMAQYDWRGLQSCLADIRESLRALDANVNLELLWIVLLSRLRRRKKKNVSCWR